MFFANPTPIVGTFEKGALAAVIYVDRSAGRCHHWDDVARTPLMFAALRRAVQLREAKHRKVFDLGL